MNPFINIETAKVQIQEDLNRTFNETFIDNFKDGDQLTEFRLKTNYPELWTPGGVSYRYFFFLLVGKKILAKVLVFSNKNLSEYRYIDSIEFFSKKIVCSHIDIFGRIIKI